MSLTIDELSPKVMLSKRTAMPPYQQGSYKSWPPFRRSFPIRSGAMCKSCLWGDVIPGAARLLPGTQNAPADRVGFWLTSVGMLDSHHTV